MKKFNLLFCCIALLSLILACSKPDSNELSTDTNPNPDPNTGSGGGSKPSLKIAIDPTTTYQTITGFGGANRMWGAESLSIEEAAKSFGTADNQLGLTLFRVRLSSVKSDWSLIVNSVKEANKYGVKVLACPWSPPAELKSNNNTTGGHLLPENYKAFKDYINEFISYMATNGAKIDVVSIQNEPDWKASYESCDYTASEFIDFLNAPGDIVGAKVAAPESLNFNQTMTNAVLSNDVAASKIDIVAGHTYGSGTAKFPLAEQKNKEIWMTEYLLNLNTGNTGAAAWSTYSETDKWNETLKMLTGIHDAMSCNWNAYIWWYIKRYYSFIGDGEQGTVSGQILKRGMAYSHFSKFIRPGFVRIANDLPSTSPFKVTTYKKGNQTVLVFVNPEPYTLSNVELSGLNPSKASSYTTNISVSMEKKDLTITNQAISVAIKPYSITTVVINN